MRKQLLSAALAYIDYLGIACDEVQNFTADERIVKHDASACEKTRRFHGKEFRISRTSADQVHLAHAGPRLARCRRASGKKTVEHRLARKMVQQNFSGIRAAIAGAQQFAGGAQPLEP